MNAAVGAARRQHQRVLPVVPELIVPHPSPTAPPLPTATAAATANFTPDSPAAPSSTPAAAPAAALG